MRVDWRQVNWPLFAAGFAFLLFFADILLAKIQISAGNSVPLHIGDTGQFLLLLVAVILFVIGTLKQEKRAQTPVKKEPEQLRR